MANEKFFELPKEPSIIKTLLVSKYFEAWANVMLSQTQDKIQYLDLFAGPGQYDEGSLSTPLIVLSKAIQNPKLRERLITVFNDSNPKFIADLQQSINSFSGIETLAYQPVVHCSPVDAEIIRRLETARQIPTLFFVDPWGYKGLSLKLLTDALRGWGCDCLFFFNYNRVNAAVSNFMVEPLMQELFGDARLESLRQSCEGRSPAEREFIVVEELCNAIRDAIRSSQSRTGTAYLLPFRFRNENGTKTSHHIIFISKHIRGYQIMKEIMAKESSTHEQGVASFEYNVATVRQPLQYSLNRPVDDLADLLCEAFAGRIVTMKEVFDTHNVDTPYIERNYKDALIQLEASNRIVAVPPAAKRRPYKGEPSFGPNVRVTFPPKENV